MIKPKHLNNGSCEKCETIINAYPGFNSILYTWFKGFQRLKPEAHIAYAGRGKADQEQAYNTGHSKAHFGQSAHNYNMALDLFKLTLEGASWDAEWYKQAVAPHVALNHALKWGGTFKSIVDLPHVEIDGWEDLVKTGKAKLVS